jgi:hypothetical protein
MLHEFFLTRFPHLLFVYLFIVVLGIEPRISCMLGKRSITELHTQLSMHFLKYSLYALQSIFM